jgi:hypothetical protein
MTTIAPRIPRSLLETIARLDNGRIPIAEINRRVRRDAEKRGLTRPSYERVRELVHLERAYRRQLRRGPSTLQLMYEAAAGFRSGASAYDAIHLPREERR